MKDRYLYKAKFKDENRWVVGHYFEHLTRTPCPIGDMVSEDDYMHFIMNSGFSDWNMPKQITYNTINVNTLCQCAKSTKRGRLWEGDIFWECYADGIIGVIEWNDDYDGWIVNLVPNTVENECVPDYSDVLETFRLDEYDGGDYEFIYDNLIGSKHDYGYKVD